EMDVIATRKKTQYLVECKYRMDQGNQISVQTPLYVRSRVDDIIRKREKMSKYQGLSFTGWVVTNTRFSADSIRYGSCSGLRLLGWDYPRGKGLQHLIQEEKLYPITVLTGLPTDLKKHMMENDIVTCSQLKQNLSILDGFELPPARHERLLKELNDICG
ncbi:ATP-binding protein, partial [bacterium]|nr:ATP-binding protein [bacterium]